MTQHEVYMKRCLELALHGAQTARPNPMVGSVVVHSGQIIGEGWHYKSGEPHAEVNAIASVKNETLLRESTIYVSLEPCSHYGKTPPCANLIIEKGIPHVVVACLDPNPAVAGFGVKLLKEEGVQVQKGVLEAEAMALNRKFITFHQKKRPYITLKWAQSADGFMDIDRTNGQKGSVAISGAEASVFVHKLRAEHAGILIGPQTAIHDNPSLTTRYFAGPDPIRLVVDRNNRIPAHLNIFNDGGKTLHFVAKNSKSETGSSIMLPREAFLQELLHVAYERGVQSILVEGGAAILNAFIRQNLWDEAFVLTAPMSLDRGLAAPGIDRAAVAIDSIGKDTLTQYLNHGLSIH
jgi:diaminohydroxyphosphoribosylaminopyrimidine deaminase/5-amino-6-(5-phosphoribosylamino)uracil reductase